MCIRDRSVHTHTHTHTHAQRVELLIGSTERETDRQTDRDREQRDKERETDRKNSNSKTLILKDSSVRSIWTYLTASPCILQTQISTTILQTDIISTNKQLINVVSQTSYKRPETSEINFFHGHTCTQQSNF